MTGVYRVTDGTSGAHPVVAFHGFLGDDRVWEPVMAAVRARSPRALATLPGHTGTPWYPTDRGFDGTVHALTAALPWKAPVVLLGYSMGARLALAMALAHPDRVAGAVLVGADPGIRDDGQRAARAAWDDAQATAVTDHGLPAFVAAWQSQPLFDSQRTLPADTLTDRGMRKAAHRPDGIAWALRTLGTGRMTPMWHSLAGTAVPLCFVAGGRDGKFLALATEAAACAPRGTVTAVDGVGHDVGLEAPDALARVVDDFVTGL